MKSKLVILTLLACIGISASAQTKEKFYSEGKDNWFIGIAGGAQVNLNPDNRDYGIGDAITPTININLGKWINPVWGIRGQAAGMWSTLYSKYQTTGNQYVEYKNKKFVTLRMEGIFNFSNAIAGYNPDRLFSFYGFMGPGLTFAKAYDDQKDVNALINGSLGLGGNFNVSKNFDIFVEVRGELSPSIFGSKSSTYTDGAVSAVAGVSYTFGGKKFAPVGTKVDVDALNNEINKYRSALAEAEAELAACRNALANVKPTTTEVVREIEVAGPRAIFFQIGKSNIDDYGMVNIQLAAKIIKANPNKKYKVAGYADKATGSASWNQKLSERRAQNVYDALVKEGVNGSQLELVGFGGTANMFGQNKLNRVVILE